jgi:hypothetical protein
MKKTYKKRGGRFGFCPPCPVCSQPTLGSLYDQGKGILQNELSQPALKSLYNQGKGILQNELSQHSNANLGVAALRMAANQPVSVIDQARVIGAVGKTAMRNPRTTMALMRLASGALGGKGKRARTRKNKRGGQNLRAFNNYNDPFTMHASRVSGYPTAMPHNWVGGRTRRRRSRR